MFNLADDTICAIATARGEGAIGIVRVSGPCALALLKDMSSAATFKPRRLTLVRLKAKDAQRPLDEVMVCYLPGPGSYTGEDLVEIYAHGGILNLERIISVLIALGARSALPGEFTRRAFLNGRLDLTQAQGVAEIIAARSEAALDNAQRLLQGELGAEIDSIRSAIVELAADLEACIDFADDVDPPHSSRELYAKYRVAGEALLKLTATYDRGSRLNGISIAFIGAVNAGKSSLFNALLGDRRALVSAEEGTTRDYIEAEADWSQQRLSLVDTAGTRVCMSELEIAGLELSQKRLTEVDLTIEVVDLNALREEVAVQTDARLIAANKSDLLGDDASAALCAQLRAVAAGRDVIVVSAVTGVGLEELKECALRLVMGCAPGGDGRETVQVTQRRQWELLTAAASAMEDGQRAVAAGLPAEVSVEHCREALHALGEIVGQGFSEAILDSVFSRFCIGK